MGRFSGLSEKLDRERRGTPEPVPVLDLAPMAMVTPESHPWIWPTGDTPFAVDDILRRAWRLEHPTRELTAEDHLEADVCVATLAEYIDSLPDEYRQAASDEMTRRLNLAPRRLDDALPLTVDD